MVRIEVGTFWISNLLVDRWVYWVTPHSALLGNSPVLLANFSRQHPRHWACNAGASPRPTD